MTEASNWTKVTIYISKNCFFGKSFWGGFYKFPSKSESFIKFQKNWSDGVSPPWREMPPRMVNFVLMCALFRIIAVLRIEIQQLEEITRTRLAEP